MLKFRLPMVVDLDDFCEEIMTKDLWSLLLDLKKFCPCLKITMFTIPFKCSRDWIKWVKKEYTWLELHYHGSDHINRDEWFLRDSFEFPYEEYFFKGFKAPWWRMDQKTADIFNSKGYVISAMNGYFDVNADKVYRFNLGKEKIKNVWYEGSYSSLHSHVQQQKSNDGLPDIFDDFRKCISGNDFLFVGELF